MLYMRVVYCIHVDLYEKGKNIAETKNKMFYVYFVEGGFLYAHVIKEQQTFYKSIGIIIVISTNI